MTDITELVQDGKAAAHKAKRANDLYLEGKITLSECVVETNDYLDYSDNPNNFLALVEALEKAQRYIEELREWNAGLAQESCEYQQRIAGIEPIRAAAEKLVRCKGRYHSEQNYRALAALVGVTAPDLPPIDGESHTVTVKLPPKIERDDADGWFVHKGGRVGGGAAEWYNKALDDVGAELTAAGIKVEAE